MADKAKANGTSRPQDEWSVSTDLLATLAVLDRQLTDGIAELCGLTLTQFRIMLKLGEVRGGARVRDIAAGLDLKPNAVSQAASRMQEQGLVERAQSANDGRAVVVALTSKGRRMAKKVKGELGSRFEEAWGDVPREMARAMDDVMRFIGALVERRDTAALGEGFSSEYVTTIAESYDTVVSTLKRAVRLSLTEWRVLCELEGEGGSMRMSALTYRLMVPRNTATWLADELASKGLTARTAGDEALNSVYVELTDEGRDTLASGHAAVDAMCRARLWKGLDSAQLARVFASAELYAEESRRRFSEKGKPQR